MKRMVNAIYNLAEECLSWEEVNLLIKDLKPLMYYKLDEENDDWIYKQAVRDVGNMLQEKKNPDDEYELRQQIEEEQS